jgi:hypothetical protein
LHLSESEKVNPQDYFLPRDTGELDGQGQPIIAFDLLNEVIADYLPARALRKKVFDGNAEIVILSDTIQVYWKSNLIAEAQLEGQIETAPDIWQGQLFSFSGANIKRIQDDGFARAHIQAAISIKAFARVLSRADTIILAENTFAMRARSAASEINFKTGGEKLAADIKAESAVAKINMPASITPFYRAYEIIDIPALGITDAVFGLDVKWAFKKTKLFFYLDAPGHNARIRWQCRVKDSAVAWTDNTDPDNPIYHKGLSFNVADYGGEVNKGSQADPEPGWSVHWWTFEPSGKMIDAADSRTPLERFKRGVGLVVDPYLTVDEQSTYIDVFCDGYVFRILTDEQNNNQIIQILNLAGDTVFAYIYCHFSVSSTFYDLRGDGERATNIIEQNSSRVKIRVKGNFEQRSAETELANSTFVELIITIYPDGFLITSKWTTSGSITIDDDTGHSICGRLFITNVTNNDIYYENSGSESDASVATYNSAKYLLAISDEINIQIINVSNLYDLNTATWNQRCTGSSAYINFGINNGSVNANTHTETNIFVIDSAEREGSAKIYNETDRLAMGNQHKDREIDLTQGGSRVFDDGSSQYLSNNGSGSPITDEPFTMACFAKTSNLATGGNQAFLSASDVSSSNVFHSIGFDDSTNKATARTRDGGAGAAKALSSSTMSVDTWHHITGRFNGDADREVFLDGGNKVQETTSKSITGANLDTVSIGALHLSSIFDPTEGKIAHAAIWNVALTDAEVLRLANGALPTEIRPEALVAYWPLIDDDNDPIGGYNMTAYNSPTWSTTDYPDVFKPDKGKWNIQNIFPAIIDESGFGADGAFHIIPVSPRVKPPTDNDDLKTAPDVDTVGGIAEDLSHWWMMNEGSGTSVDDKGSGANNGTISGADWIDAADPDTGLDFISANSDKVDLASNITIGTNDFTVIAKVKIDATLNDTDPGILGAGNSGAGYASPLQIDSGTGKISFELDGTQYTSTGLDITDGLEHTIAVSADRSGNAIIYIDGVVDDTISISAKSAVSLTVSSPDIGNNPHTAGRFLDGEIHYLGMWIGRALSADEIRFVTNNPYWMFGDAGRAKLTLDRTRIRPNVVIDDWPYFYGPKENPTDILLNHLKMDDNAANNTLQAEVGPNGTWHAVSDDSARNTSNDSVQTDNFRGRALDTQNGTGFGKLAVGAGTVHDNAFFKKGSRLTKIIPQFIYTAGTSTITQIYIADSNRINIWWDSSGDRLRFQFRWGGTESIGQIVFTENYSLQREMVFLESWDSDKDFVLFALDGQVLFSSINTGTPSTSEPTAHYIGVYTGRLYPSDIIIDEIKTFSEAVLPYGAMYIGDGAGLLADINKPHADLSWFFDGQAALAKGGSNLATDKNPTNSGGQFVTTDPIIGVNHWDSNGASNVLTIADVSEDIIDYNKGFVAGWFQVQSAAGGEYLIDVRDGDGSDRISAVLDASNNIDVTYRSNSTDEIITGDIAVTDGVWFFLKITWNDTGKVHCFINGMENGTAQDIANVWGGGNGLTWYFTEDYNGANGVDAFIGNIYMGKDDNTPEIWTAFGKPLHTPLTLKR